MINRSNKVPLVWIMRNCVSWMKSMLSRKQDFSIKKFFVCKLLAINYKRSFDLWRFVKLCKFDWHIPIFHLLNISIFDEEETFSFRNILCKSLPWIFKVQFNELMSSRDKYENGLNWFFGISAHSYNSNFLHSEGLFDPMNR